MFLAGSVTSRRGGGIRCCSATYAPRKIKIRHQRLPKKKTLTSSFNNRQVRGTCLCICELTYADNSNKAIQWGFLCLSQYLQVADHKALHWSVHSSVIRILQFGVCFLHPGYCSGWLCACSHLHQMHILWMTVLLLTSCLKGRSEGYSCGGEMRAGKSR